MCWRFFYVNNTHPIKTPINNIHVQKACAQRSRSSLARGQWHFVLYSLRDSLRAHAPQLGPPAKSSYSCMHVSISSATARSSNSSHSRTRSTFQTDSTSAHGRNTPVEPYPNLGARLRARVRSCWLLDADADAAAAPAAADAAF